jgi:hypothetical protein
MDEIIRHTIRTHDAWTGNDIQHSTRWLFELEPADIAEIDRALAFAGEDGATVPFGRERFPLEKLAAKIDRIVDEVSDGVGLALLRGLPRERYSDDECALIYWGIAQYIGRPVTQNARGHLIGHVRDEGRAIGEAEARGYQTAAQLNFHTDMLPVDVLGLFCLRTARSGGTSYIVSAATLHNVMLAERPDLLEVLYEPFYVDWRGDGPQGGDGWYVMPMFSSRDGRVANRFTNRAYLEGTARFGDAYALTDRQREAFVYALETAARPELRLSMTFEEGDMQFVNNHVTLHAREAFVDHDDPSLQRHLLRLWIALPDERRRPLSPRLDERYEWVRRGGMPRRSDVAEADGRRLATAD